MFLGALFLIGISVWLVPLVERARLPLLCAMVLIIGTVFGPAFFSIDGPLLISLDRVLFVVLCIVAFFSLRGSTASLPQLTKSDWIVAAYVVWVFVSTLGGDAPAKTSPLGTWIFYVLLPAMMYGVARVASVNDVDLRRLETAFLALGLYLAVTGFFESRGWYSLVFPKYIADAEHWEFFGRGRGPLLNPSANGILLTLGLAVAALKWLRAGRAGRIGYGIAVLVMMAGIYATLTRSVWIGGALALAIVFWQVTPRWFKVLSLCASILLAGLAVAGLKEQLLRMKRDKNLSAAEAEKSVQLRPLLAIVAYEMAKDAPFAGHGFGYYQKAAKPYYTVRGYGLPLETTRGYHQHNVLLSILVNNGMVGLLMFSGLLWLWVRAGWQLSKDARANELWRHAGLIGVASIAGYLVGGMFQDVTIMPTINMFLFFLAGLLVTLEQTMNAAGERTPSRIVATFTARSNDDRETEVAGGAFQPAAS
jgi:O-antigen ligase